MDSKNIYISYQHYSDKIEWETHGDSEWIYIGINEEFKREKVVELINTFFKEDKIYLITDRHNSSMIEKKMGFDKVLDNIQEFNPALVSLDFYKIIEFNRIGVLRKGQRIKL